MATPRPVPCIKVVFFIPRVLCRIFIASPENLPKSRIHTAFSTLFVYCFTSQSYFGRLFYLLFEEALDHFVCCWSINARVHNTDSTFLIYRFCPNIHNATHFNYFSRIPNFSNRIHSQVFTPCLYVTSPRGGFWIFLEIFFGFGVSPIADCFM